MRFANPVLLVLFIIVPILIFLYVRLFQHLGGTIRYSNIGTIKSISNSRFTPFRHIIFVLRILVISLLILAFARPQSGRTEQEVITEGIDIIMALDISRSMLAEDFKPKNRVQAAKQVAADFIKGRKNDRIGLVVFAAKSYTQCPLTIDYGILLNFLEEIEVGLIEDGTAIGMGLANCVNRFRHSKAKSKVVILLTDGVNNRGELDPITAAGLAKALDVRVYTIGVGKRGDALYPVDDPFFGKRYVRMPVQIDEEVLKQIADITGAKYFRATDENSLMEIYKEINQLEKTKYEIKEYTRYKELYLRLLLLAFSLLIIEIALANTIFRKIP